MILGVGVDIVEVSRIEDMLARWNNRFLARVFTREEIDLCNNRSHRAASFAVRFAAKEACAKALGTGWNATFSWRDFSVRTEGNGRPTPCLSPRLQQRLGATQVHLSLSHSDQYAVAIVILEAA